MNKDNTFQAYTQAQAQHFHSKGHFLGKRKQFTDNISDVRSLNRTCANRFFAKSSEQRYLYYIKNRPEYSPLYERIRYIDKNGVVKADKVAINILYAVMTTTHKMLNDANEHKPLFLLNYDCRLWDYGKARVRYAINHLQARGLIIRLRLHKKNYLALDWERLIFYFDPQCCNEWFMPVNGWRCSSMLKERLDYFSHDASKQLPCDRYNLYDDIKASFFSRSSGADKYKNSVDNSLSGADNNSTLVDSLGFNSSLLVHILLHKINTNKAIKRPRKFNKNQLSLFTNYCDEHPQTKESKPTTNELVKTDGNVSNSTLSTINVNSMQQEKSDTHISPNQQRILENQKRYTEQIKRMQQQGKQSTHTVKSNHHESAQPTRPNNPTRRVKDNPPDTQACRDYRSHQTAAKAKTATDKANKTEQPNESVDYSAMNVNGTIPYLAEMFTQMQAVYLWKFKQQPSYDWLRRQQGKYSELTIQETFAKIETYCKGRPVYAEQRKALSLVFNKFVKDFDTPTLEFARPQQRLYDLAFSAYKAAYKHYFNDTPLITDRWQKRALVKIMEQITTDNKQHIGSNVITDDMLVTMFKTIMHRSPEWLKKNPASFTPKALYNNYGVTCTLIKQGKNSRGSQTNTLNEKDVDLLKNWGVKQNRY